MVTDQPKTTEDILAGLSKEEILEKANEEKLYLESLRINPLVYYKPQKWQKSLHLLGHPKSIRAVFGGNQIGKTTWACAEMVMHMTQMYPDWYPGSCRRDGKEGRPGPPLEAIQVGPDFENWLEQVYLPKFLSLLPAELAEPIKVQGKIRGYRIKYLDLSHPQNNNINPHHKNVVHFQSYLQDTFAFEGKTIDIAGFDEPPPFGIWTATKRGLMAKDGISFLSLTPLTEPWLDSEISEQEEVNKDIHTMRVEIWENTIERGGYLRKDQIESFLDSIPEEERLAREKGQFRHLSGVVYPELGPIHQIDDFSIPLHWTWYEAIDPHGARPSCIIFAAVDPEGYVYIVDQAVVDGSAPDLFQVCQEIRAKHGGRTPTWTVVDKKAATQRNKVGGKETSWEKELRHSGFHRLVFSDSSPGSVGAGVRILKEYLKPEYNNLLQENVPKLRFFKNATSVTQKDRRGAEYGVWFQMRRVQWDESVQKSIHERATPDKIKDVHKDFPDTVRYLVERKPKYVDPFKPKYISRSPSQSPRGITGY